MATHECRHDAATHQCWCARNEDHDARGFVPEPQISSGGVVRRSDGESCRVTSIKGVWGYWVNGTRTGPFDTREDAARHFLATQPNGPSPNVRNRPETDISSDQMSAHTNGSL